MGMGRSVSPIFQTSSMQSKENVWQGPMLALLCQAEQGHLLRMWLSGVPGALRVPRISRLRFSPLTSGTASS